MIATPQVPNCTNPILARPDSSCSLSFWSQHENPSTKTHLRKPIYENSAPPSQTVHCSGERREYGLHSPVFVLDACTQPKREHFNNRYTPALLDQFAHLFEFLQISLASGLSRLRMTKTTRRIDPRIPRPDHLANGFIYRNRDTSRQVQRPLTHDQRHTHPLIWVPRVDLVRQPGALAPKDQMIPHRNRRIKDRPRCFGRKEPGPWRSFHTRRMLAQVRLHRVVLNKLKPRPIIEPSPSARLLIRLKTKRMDQMQSAPRRHTGTPDVPGIIGDLGFNKHDMEPRPFAELRTRQ